MFNRTRFNWWMPALTLVLVAAISRPAAAGALPEGYPLTVAPVELHDRFAKTSFGKSQPIPDNEQQLLNKVWSQRVKKTSAVDNGDLLNAMLFASGVGIDADRKKYAKQLDQLVDAAKSAVGESGDASERGAKLMAFLHKGAMKNGYADHQSSVAVLFDTGKYNCVSSAALYYLVGARLGLELRPISIPGSAFSSGHATLDQIVGDKSIWVETTNPDGFDWEKKLSQPGVFVIGPQPNRKHGQAISPWGLAAMIYSNRGVEAKKSVCADNAAAVRCYLAALALEPSDLSARQNLTATFANWGPELAKENRFDDAVAVMAFAQDALPKAGEVRDNFGFVWTRFIEHELENGRDENAVAAVRKARQALPEDRDFRSPATWICRHGDKLIKAHGWEKGLDDVERGQKILGEDDMKVVKEWRTGVYRRWSQACLKRKDVDGSLKVLKRVYDLDASDKEVRRGIEYHVEEALRMLATESELKAVVAHFGALRQAFPSVSGVEETAVAFAHRRVDKLTDAQQFTRALSEVDRLAPLLPATHSQLEVREGVYDAWARQLAKGGKWQAAIEKYVEGLKACSKSDRLATNAIATVDEWADGPMRIGKWDEAIEIYRTGLKYFPGDRHLTHNLKYCEHKKSQ